MGAVSSAQNDSHINSLNGADAVQNADGSNMANAFLNVHNQSATRSGRRGSEKFGHAEMDHEGQLQHDADQQLRSGEFCTDWIDLSDTRQYQSQDKDGRSRYQNGSEEKKRPRKHNKVLRRKGNRSPLAAAAVRRIQARQLSLYRLFT